MTKNEFNTKVQQHLGSLQGIDETMPACDKPCNVHETMRKKQSHEVAVLCLLATYTGNGMGDEIAARVCDKINTTTLAPPKALTFVLPGTDRVVSVATAALSTWTFRFVILLFLSWLANGKIDRETVRTVVADAMKAQMEQVQPLSKAAPTSENTEFTSR